MAEERKMKSRQEMLQDIINAGKSIIVNAEDILGDEKYFLNTNVSFTITREMDRIPTINIKREFIPEDAIDTVKEQDNNSKVKEDKKDGK